MNFYGEHSADEHTIAGRVFPLMEAMDQAISRAANRPVSEPKHSAQLPVWCHNICDIFAKTIFRVLVDAAPEQGKFNARDVGRISGMLLRCAAFVHKDAPALIKEEGLDKLTADKERRLDQVAGWNVLFAAVSNHLQKPVRNKKQLVKAGEKLVESWAERLMGNAMVMLKHLANASADEQHEFLCGVADGFVMYLKPDGEFSGKRKRFEIYMLLLMRWPEVCEMQGAQPPKTRRELLKWLEEHEGKQLVEDDKVFNELCGDIGLDLTSPGRPQSADQE